MSAFRFIHTADIHLDSPLRTLALKDERLATLVGTATRRAFIKIIDLCIEEQVNALIIAGDLYDGKQTSMTTAFFMKDQMQRLDAAGIKVFIIRGNHDAESKIPKDLVQPGCVKIFKNKAEKIKFPHTFPVFIHGMSFVDAHAPDSLLNKYHQPVEEAFNIGIMHTSLGGTKGHDNYAPCSSSDLHAHGFNYWALGHIHKRDVIKGASTIVMPGMPQGRDIGEAGQKSVSLVTVNEDFTVDVQEFSTSIAQFERLDIDITDVSKWRELLKKIEVSIKDLRANHSSENLIIRLKLFGTTPLAWEIRTKQDLLKTEADLFVNHLMGCYVEELELKCHAPVQKGEANINPLIELNNIITENIFTSLQFEKDMEETLDDLKKQLPPQLRDNFGKDEASMKAMLLDLAKTGVEDIVAQLSTGAE